MTSIPARDWAAEADKQTAAVLAERAKLCNPLAIDAAFVTLANIAARAELVRVRREVARRAIRKAIRPVQLPLKGLEAA